MLDSLVVIALGWGFVALMVAIVAFGFLVPREHAPFDDEPSDDRR